MLINLGVDEQIVVDEVISITKCVFCEKNLTAKHDVDTSKLLPCLHAACLSCIHDCLDKGKKLCPSCSLPFAGEKLCDNKVLFEIVSDVDLPRISNKLCSIHNAYVTNWCQDCNDFICEECVKSHGQLKSTIAHSIISKDSHFVRLLASTPKTVFPCGIHSKNNLTVYCHTCRTLTCRDCQLEGHKDHKYDFITDEVDTAKVEIFNFLKRIEYNAVIMKSALEKCEEKQAELSDMKKKLIVDIKNEFDKIRKILQKREKELMLSAISKVNSKLEECGNNQSLLTKNLSVVNRCINFVKCVLFTSSDSVLFYTKDLMTNYMKNINFNVRIPCSYGTSNLIFDPQNMNDLKNKILGCGVISENYNTTQMEKKDIKEFYSAILREWASRKQLFHGMEGSKKIFLSANSFFESESTFWGSKDTDLRLLEDGKSSENSVNVKSSKLGKFMDKLPANRFMIGQNLSIIPEPSQKLQPSSSERDQLPCRISNSYYLASSQSQNHLQPTSQHQHIKCSNHWHISSSLLVNKNPQSVPNSTPKTWHIPENVQLTQASFLEGSHHGENIKRVKILKQPPQIDFQSLVNEEIIEALFSAELERSEERNIPPELSSQLSPSGSNEGWCSVCLRSGSLVYCSYCPKGFHRNCHIPSIETNSLSDWRCLLCEDITPLPPATYHYFRPDERKVANRLLLEMFCQVEASLPFRRQIPTFEKNRPSISLVDIRKNLTKGKYISILKFIADIRMLLVNCFHYHKDEPQVTAHAKALEEIFTRLLTKFIPHLNASSKIPTHLF